MRLPAPRFDSPDDADFPGAGVHLSAGVWQFGRAGAAGDVRPGRAAPDAWSAGVIGGVNAAGGTLALAFEFQAIIALPAVAMVWLLGNGILTYMGGRSQQYIAISLVGASRVTPIVGGAALFAALYAIMFTRLGVPGFDEHLNAPIAVGTVVVVVGLALTGGNLLRQSWGRDWHSVLGYVLALSAAPATGRPR